MFGASSEDIEVKRLFKFLIDLTAADEACVLVWKPFNTDLVLKFGGLVLHSFLMPNTLSQPRQ